MKFPLPRLRKATLGLAIGLISTLVFSVPLTVQPQGFHPVSGLMTCTATAVPATSRAEDIAELLGDVIAQCTLSSNVGVPPSVQANIGVTLNVNVTNNRDFGLGSEVTDAILIVNDVVGTPTANSTPSFTPNTPIPQYGTRVSPNRLEWNGAILPMPGVSGNPNTLTIRITNMRGNVSQLGIPGLVTAELQVSSTPYLTIVTGAPQGEGDRLMIGAVPNRTDLSLAVDTRPRSLIGIPAGKDPQEVANQFAEYQITPIPGGGTILRVPGDPRTVGGLVGGFNPAFVEIDPCTIMTPLTTFRGHDHESHIQSHRAIHDHQGPDPPWTWGRTPPEIVIRWEAEK